jgi:hypothetical protein
LIEVKDPTTTTLKHVKSFLTEAMWHALRQGLFGEDAVQVNPLAGESLKLEGRRSEPTYAYSLAEVEAMLRVLKNETYKTIVTRSQRILDFA